MPERTNEAMQLVKDQAAAIAQAIVEQAANRAVYGGERAKGAASRARGTAKRTTSRVHLRKKADDPVANVREIALAAASAALELWQTARERAEDLAQSAEEEVAEPAVRLVGRADKKTREAVATVADEVSGRAKHVSKSVVQHTDDLSERARDATKQVALRADDVSERAKTATRSVAETTVSTGRDTGATLLWSAAAAGIVFYVMMDKDRREQVLSVLDAVVEQSREIIRDFQGYDEDFG